VTVKEAIAINPPTAVPTGLLNILRKCITFSLDSLFCPLDTGRHNTFAFNWYGIAIVRNVYVAFRCSSALWHLR
jgi:hypothetical protein